MISNKTILAYKKAVQNINKAVEKEIDSFEMDYDKFLNKFICFFGDKKCDVVIVKHANKYVYDCRIYDIESGSMIYYAEFRISEHTGKAMAYELKVLNI